MKAAQIVYRYTVNNIKDKPYEFFRRYTSRASTDGRGCAKGNREKQETLLIAWCLIAE